MRLQFAREALHTGVGPCNAGLVDQVLVDRHEVTLQFELRGNEFTMWLAGRDRGLRDRR